MIRRTVRYETSDGRLHESRNQAKKWERILYRNRHNDTLSFDGYKNLRNNIRMLEQKQKEVKSRLSHPHQNLERSNTLQFRKHYQAVALSYLYSVLREVNSGLG